MKKGLMYVSLFFILLSSVFVAAQQRAQTPRQAIEEATEIIKVFFTGENAPFFLAVVLTFLLFYSAIEMLFNWITGAGRGGSTGIFDGNKRAGISMALSGLFTLAVFYNTTARDYIGGLRIFIGYPAIILILAVGYFAYSRTINTGAHWSWAWGVGLLVIGISMIWVGNSFPQLTGSGSWIAYGVLIAVLAGGIGLLGYSAKFAVGGGYGGSPNNITPSDLDSALQHLPPSSHAHAKNMAALMSRDIKDLQELENAQVERQKFVDAINRHAQNVDAQNADQIHKVLSATIVRQQKKIAELDTLIGKGIAEYVLVIKEVRKAANLLGRDQQIKTAAQTGAFLNAVSSPGGTEYRLKREISDLQKLLLQEDAILNGIFTASQFEMKAEFSNNNYAALLQQEKAQILSIKTAHNKIVAEIKKALKP